MKASQLATLVLRLMGIYCLAMMVPLTQAFNVVFLIPLNSPGSLGVSMVVATFILLAGWLAVGISLIAFSTPLAKLLTPQSCDANGIKAISFEQAQVLAFAVAGILIFAEALPQLINNVFAALYYLFQLEHDNPVPNSTWPFNRFGVFNAIGDLLKTALGLYLFFRAQGFASFWRSLRALGTPKAPEVQQHEKNQ